MKPFISLLMLICFANFTNAQSPEDYAQLWKQVSDFENKGLPKSALEVVEDIEQRAKASNNSSQEIKTLLYRSKFALILEEDAQFNVINDFKTAISNSDVPTKNVLHNMLATLYWQYFNQNRWKFYNRTKTSEKVDTDDFRTWDLQTLFDEVHYHYEASLANGLILQQTDLKGFEAILIKQKNSEIFRPTVFDLLSHNALEFYKTDENTITKPAYKFEVDTPKLLSPTNEFALMAMESRDSTSLQLHALEIYQSLLKFHLNAASPDALVAVDIERLNFVYQKATFENKDSLLLNTLNSEYKKWNTAKQDVASLYAFEIAKLYQQQGQQYKPETALENRWKYKSAIEICDTAIRDYPNSTGADMCRVLKAKILSQSLQITTEDVVPIGKNTLALISYKNLNTINFKIGKLSDAELKSLRSHNKKNKRLKILNQMQALHSWTTQLKDENDFQQHSTEIAIPKLENGRYVIFGLVANEKNTYTYKELQVTNSAYIQKEFKGDVSYQIINRLDGQPITNANVTLSYIKNYGGNYQSQNYVTDDNGMISIGRQNYNRSRMKLQISTNNDDAIFENLYIGRYYDYGDNEPNYPLHKAFLFTDRSIYRPGQPLYFKGIVMSSNRNSSEVLAATSVDVMMYNVNGEEVHTLTLKTNEFGSVSGEFIIPNNGLTGNYSIKLKGKNNINARHAFSVEEYKRPKFEVEFEPVTETFKINDTIKVKGNAVAYAGSTISDAKVVYRVRRNVRYPDWYYWYRPYFTSEPQEITHGETETDAQGNFEVDFKAIPDSKVDPSSLPIFNYEITADITDLNGETRSTSTIVNVGYHAMIASLDIANVLNKDDKAHQITIETRNLNGESVDAVGTLKMYKLNAPNSVLRPRPWKAPDYQEFSKEVFEALFPNQAYKNEHDSRTWEKGELVFSESFDTKTSKEVALGRMKNWTSGTYRIVLESEDRFGQSVKDEAQVTLYSVEDTSLADNGLFNVTTNKSEYAIGDFAELTFASAADDLVLTVEIEKDSKIISAQIITLSANKKTISMPVTSDDLGGFAVHYSYAFSNSFIQGSMPIVVPYPKTDLDIETLTFRDKLQPGTDETWQFKIKGSQGDKVTAELLASMYDASLDQFKPHSWSFDPIQHPSYYSRYNNSAGKSFRISQFNVENIRHDYGSYYRQSYDRLNFFGLSFGYGNRYLLRGKVAGLSVADDEAVMEAVTIRGNSSVAAAAPASEMDSLEDADSLGEEFNDGDSRSQQEYKAKTDFSDIKIRKNLQETAFFFPQLQTDKDGNVSFSFTTPEALTKWKLQLLAHTKSLESATSTLETVTQKELMVLPNAPRFLREGDQIKISSKISNLTEKELTGVAVLQLFDAVTGESIDQKLSNAYNDLGFTVSAKGNTSVTWNLDIPYDVDAVQYKVIAKAGDFSDGEQNALPVLSNRMLVTETLPMWIKSNETRTFTLDKLKNVSSPTLKHHKLTLEMTSNPAWYAVQALPYLMEYPYDCNEQTFSRYYANALASHIANSNPRVQEVFNQWRNSDALLSNLEKNQELKSILIQETPWLRDAQSETEQKKRIALLFDLNKMNNELASAMRKLKNGQMSNGAWPWFNGGRPNRYITQHIITGFGHLDKLGVTLNAEEASKDSKMITKAIAFLDAEFVKEYEDIKKYNPKADLSKDHLSHTQLHYLYMRSFFPQIKKSNNVQEITEYYQSQIRKYWLNRSLYAKGLMAIVVDRMDDKTTSAKILKSLRENSITSEELGMYWKANTSSWHWYQAPIETQALLIEAFSEIENDTATIDNLKIWLLKNKQTNRWSTTKATTEAVYALLLQGSDWLSVTDMVDVVLGEEQLQPSTLENVKVEAGTGYYKTSWSASEIKPDMATVSLSKKGDGIAWGSLYWQYFEDLDKITSAETPLKLEKKLFKKTNTDLGEEITEISSDTSLKVGDLVRVRIELRSDRDMEFVHMKDMRAAGFEPLNVLSQYKYQDGLGYYESTKDASTNFFFDYLPKGIYVFEYDLRVNNAGRMSNGITTIQSMYAPEFSSHSEGIRVLVSEDQ